MPGLVHRARPRPPATSRWVGDSPNTPNVPHIPSTTPATPPTSMVLQGMLDGPLHFPLPLPRSAPCPCLPAVCLSLYPLWCPSTTALPMPSRCMSLALPLAVSLRLRNCIAAGCDSATAYTTWVCFVGSLPLPQDHAPQNPATYGRRCPPPHTHTHVRGVNCVSVP